jgi:hypothetical protein
MKNSFVVEDGKLVCNDDKPLNVECDCGKEESRHLAGYLCEAYTYRAAWASTLCLTSTKPTRRAAA